MIDYLSHPKASLVRVKRTYDSNVSLGVPRTLLSRYYRAANPNTGEAEWRLPADDGRWDELIPFIEAQKLYAEPAHVTPSAALAARIDADRRRVAREQYRAKVRALPGGMDPLWKYSSDGDDVAGEDDLRFMLGEHNVGGWTKTWYPRLVLRMRYGTTSLREYAAQHGVHPPA